MLPDFDDHGYLPAGVHRATIAELHLRFGQHSEIRRVQWESIEWLLAAAPTIGVERILFNGSWTTEIDEPNDVDCLLVVRDDRWRNTSEVELLLAGYPFLSLQIVTDAQLKSALEFFLTDRHDVPKGLVEVRL